MMKKLTISIILILLLCVPFTGAYAYDLLYEDFETGQIDENIWITDFRSGPESGITTVDENQVMHVKGTFNPRTQANIDAGKDYRHAMLRASSINPGNTDPLRISFDIKIDELGVGSTFKLNFTSGSRSYAMLNFLDSGDIKVGYRARQDGGERFEMGEWYTVSIEHKPSSAKPFTVTITPHDEAKEVITKGYDLDRIFNSSIKTQVEANGINIIDFFASGVGAEDDESKVEVYYDNIRIETAPSVKNVSIQGDAITGSTLTADYTAQITDGELKIEWYAENGDEDILLGEEESYIIQREDAGKKIYVKITPSDRSGYIANAVSSDATEAVKAFTLQNNTNILSQNIVFAYPVDITTFDGAIELIPANEDADIVVPAAVKIIDGESKLVCMEFAEGALSFNTEYTVVIYNDAKYITDGEEEPVSCSGEAVFTTRQAPGIVLSGQSVEEKEGIMLLSTVKLSTNADDYEKMNVYAQLLKENEVIKTHSFLMDVSINTDYILSAGFIMNQKADSIRWVCEKEGAEMSNVLIQTYEEAEQ